MNVILVRMYQFVKYPVHGNAIERGVIRTDREYELIQAYIYELEGEADTPDLSENIIVWPTILRPGDKRFQ